MGTKVNGLKLPKLLCGNCGHRWVPRVEDVRKCPRCGATRWDRPKSRNPNAAIRKG